MIPTAGPPLPLAEASRRQRRPPGRPRRTLAPPPLGLPVPGAGPAPALNAAPVAHRAATVLPRGLSVETTGAYLGLPVRSVWRLAAVGLLRPVRWPGLRRVTFDRLEVEGLFGDAFKDAPPRCRRGRRPAPEAVEERA